MTSDIPGRKHLRAYDAFPMANWYTHAQLSDRPGFNFFEQFGNVPDMRGCYKPRVNALCKWQQ